MKGQALEGNQKPMEEEESDTSAATSKRASIRSADQHLEVEQRDATRRCLGANGKGVRRAVMHGGCRQVRFFEGCMRTGDGVTRSYSEGGFGTWMSALGFSSEQLESMAAEGS